MQPLPSDTFEDHRAAPPQTVVCSPHFDDAVLNCWSVLERQDSCCVANVFTGAPRPGFTSWYDRQTGAACSTAHVQERAAEDAEALSLAGKKAINLGLLEDQYRFRQSTWLHALFLHARPVRFVVLRIPFRRRPLYTTPPPSAQQIAQAVASAVPSGSTLWVPAGIGGHPDHVLVRDAGLLLASRGVDVRLYADLPYAIQFGWPDWLQAPDEHRAPDRASRLWLRYLEIVKPHIGDPIAQACVVRLTSEERARKEIAVRRYRTQFASLNGWKGGHRFDQDSTFAFEVFWHVTVDAAKARSSRSSGEQALASV